jgi:hypothetical protein
MHDTKAWPSTYLGISVGWAGPLGVVVAPRVAAGVAVRRRRSALVLPERRVLLPVVLPPLVVVRQYLRRCSHHRVRHAPQCSHVYPRNKEHHVYVNLRNVIEEVDMCVYIKTLNVWVYIKTLNVCVYIKTSNVSVYIKTSCSCDQEHASKAHVPATCACTSAGMLSAC